MKRVRLVLALLPLLGLGAFVALPVLPTPDPETWWGQPLLLAMAEAARHSLGLTLGALALGGTGAGLLGLVLAVLSGCLHPGERGIRPGLAEGLTRLGTRGLLALLRLLANIPLLVLALLLTLPARSLNGNPYAGFCLVLALSVLPGLTLRAWSRLMDTSCLPHLRTARLQGEGAIGLLGELLPFTWRAAGAALLGLIGPLLLLAATLSFFGLGLPDAALPDQADLGLCLRRALWTGLGLAVDAPSGAFMAATGGFAAWDAARWAAFLAPALTLWGCAAACDPLAAHLRAAHTTGTPAPRTFGPTPTAASHFGKNAEAGPESLAIPEPKEGPGHA